MLGEREILDMSKTKLLNYLRAKEEESLKLSAEYLEADEIQKCNYWHGVNMATREIIEEVEKSK